ncbi:MAG: hypothetical protein WD118_06765 [Phycisphaeraceae bacterium]
MDTYAQQAAALAEELVESLTEDEIQFLRDALSCTSLNAWQRWLREAADEIRAFARSTPAARRKRVSWQTHFPVLTHAAYLHYAKAHAVLLALSQHDLTPGGSYRDTAVRAGDAYRTALEAEADFPEWPWDGDSPIPFD